MNGPGDDSDDAVIPETQSNDDNGYMRGLLQTFDPVHRAC